MRFSKRDLIKVLEICIDNDSVLWNIKVDNKSNTRHELQDLCRQCLYMSIKNIVKTNPCTYVTKYEYHGYIITYQIIVVESIYINVLVSTI